MLINKLYRPQGIATTTFEPVHSKGLSNEFFCYANFECDRWKWKGGRIHFLTLMGFNEVLLANLCIVQ